MEALSKLKPSFKKDGTTTAGTHYWCHCNNIIYNLRSTPKGLPFGVLGNASQVSDGAGAVLLMKRSVAAQKGLPILGVFR